jgi:hypothetical protein
MSPIDIFLVTISKGFPQSHLSLLSPPGLLSASKKKAVFFFHVELSARWFP